MNIMHDISPERIRPADFIATIEITKGSKKKYELDKETYKDAYRREFICAQRFAEFCKNEMLVDFFEQRAKKYLN